MSAPVPPGFMGGAPGMEQQPEPGEDILAILGELQVAGVDVRAGPNGTIILTGTPSGVGVGRTPQRWLHPGDRVEVEIEEIGRLENLVV